MPDWAQIRSEFPSLHGRTFLNTAEFGQLSAATIQAVMRHFEQRTETACASFLSWFDDMDAIRRSVARLVNASADDIAFLPNAASALGLMMTSIDWRAGDVIVTLENEFPNNLYFPAFLAARGVEFRAVAIDRLESAIDARTRLVVMSTVNYTSGYRPDLETVRRLADAHGALFYLDGTQSLGALRFDTALVRPDMFAVHGYKWLVSPNGAGFAYVRPDLRERLTPTVIGWRSDRRWRDVGQLHHGSPEFASTAEKYEGGMLPFPSLYGMGASVDQMLAIGPETIEKRVLGLADRCARVLEGAGARVLHRGSPILAARFDDGDAGALARQLREQQIFVSARHGNLRVSVHFYNNEEDLETLGEALRRR